MHCRESQAYAGQPLASKYEGTTTEITKFSYTGGSEKRSGASLMIKATTRYCYIPTRMTETKKTDNSKC